MQIYSGDLKTFNEHILYGVIEEKILEGFHRIGRSGVSESERRSWNASLDRLSNVLGLGSGIDQECKVSIEFPLPLSSKRIDFLITGEDDKHRKNVVIIELKQWDSCTATNLENTVIAYVGHENRSLAHPSYQALSYAETLHDFNEAVRSEQIAMHPCAFLHNFRANPETTIKAPQYREILQMSPAFLERDAVKLREFIKKFITKHDDGDILYCVDNGRIRPSKALQDCVSEMLDGNEVFHMIDEQQVAFATIKAYADAISSAGKHVIIVRGGPGTGKTVIAIRLLSYFLNKGKNVAYVTKTTAVREVFKKELLANQKKKKFIDGLFKGSGCFVDCEPDTFDVLLADEAHRLNEKSGIFHNKGENQIKEIINAARISVFFLDEDQVVTTSDIGSEEEIRRQAKAVGAKVLSGKDLELVSQFRCNGSDGYLAFLDRILGIRETANFNLEDIDYDFEVFDNPCEMREALRAKNGNNKARLLAGYTYNWVSKNDRDQMDIRLPGGFEAQWNFSDTQTWAIDAESFDQVGCIHTSQGLEFDYVGVIIGQDLVFKDGCIETDFTKRAKTDKSLMGIKKTKNYALADRIIRNTYRTLMSRGQKGCYVYCEDQDLRDYLKKFAKAKR